MRCSALAWGNSAGHEPVRVRESCYNWEKSNKSREYHYKKDICYAECHRIH